MSRTTPDLSYDPWRHRYTVLVAIATVALLGAGGLVTSTGSGLAVPDWPLSFGKVMPPMQGGVLFEHGHRLVAGTVGLLSVGLALWYQRREGRRGVRRAAWVALAAVVFQGILGGLTVLLRLPPLVSVLHACLAQGFFALVVGLAVVTSRHFVATPPAKAEIAARRSLPAVVAAGVVFFQLILGAVMRHTGAGLAIPDFPLAFGGIVPPQWSLDVAVHFAHRVTALVVVGLVGWTALSCGRERARPDIAIPARFAFVLVLVQVMLGGASVMSRLAVVPTTAHLVNGALLLATLLVTAIAARRGAGPVVAPSALRGAFGSAA